MCMKRYLEPTRLTQVSCRHDWCAKGMRAGVLHPWQQHDDCFLIRSLVAKAVSALKLATLTVRYLQRRPFPMLPISESHQWARYSHCLLT